MQFAYSVGERPTRSSSPAVPPERAHYISAISIADDLEGQAAASDETVSVNLGRDALIRFMGDRVRARGGNASAALSLPVVQFSSAAHFSSVVQSPGGLAFDLSNGARPTLASSVAVFTSIFDALEQLRSTVSLLEISASAFQRSAASSRSVGCDWEKAIQDLWETVGVSSDGDDPIASETVSSIERLLPVLRPIATLPTFEAHDDGSVSLRWEDGVRPRSFALHFYNHFVNAILSAPTLGGGFAERIEAANELAVLRVLQREAVADLLR